MRHATTGGARGCSGEISADSARVCASIRITVTGAYATTVERSVTPGERTGSDPGQTQQQASPIIDAGAGPKGSVSGDAEPAEQIDAMSAAPIRWPGRAPGGGPAVHCNSSRLSTTSGNEADRRNIRLLVGDRAAAVTR